MKSENKHSQPFIIVLSVTLLLVLISNLNLNFSWNNNSFKKVDLFSDIRTKVVSKKIILAKKIAKDSIAKKEPETIALQDIKIDSTGIFDYGTDVTPALHNFFTALDKVKKKKGKVRIAYFGDSMIEGDLISQDLRAAMQERFGGYGVGFVPITSIVAGFRKSIIHTYGNWKTYNLLGAVPAQHYLGISGYSFIPQTITDFFEPNASDSWVKYTAVNQKHLNVFYDIKLLYGKTTSENYLLLNNSTYKLDGTQIVNELEIASNKPITSFKATFRCKDPLDIYGFSIESDSGAFVDNFSFRGNSGLSNTKIPAMIYKRTNDYLNYDLVILGYGLNAVSPKVTDYSWYAKGMNRVIQMIKNCFPNTSVLLISVGDKGYRVNEAYEPDPSVPLLVEEQRKLAENNQLAFWSLYDAMGGSGSMVKWAEGDTVLANKDYTHFNLKGAHKVGKLLFNKLMNEYNDYVKEQTNP